MTSIYDKKYNYSQVKAICELAKYNNILQFDYETIINIALGYYDEWKRLVRNKNHTTFNRITGNKIKFLNKTEYAYEQAYFDRRIKEDYLL